LPFIITEKINNFRDLNHVINPASIQYVETLEQVNRYIISGHFFFRLMLILVFNLIIYSLIP